MIPCGVIIAIIITIVLIMGKMHYDQMKYSEAMMRLWLDHLLYTRAVVVSVLSTGNDSKAVPILNARLLQNQSAIGALFGKRYGSAAGQTLAASLQKHIQLAADALNAVKTKDAAAIATAKTKLYSNADDIGKFIDSTMGLTDVFTTHMKHHIDTLLANVVAYSASDYPADVNTLDAYVEAGTNMAMDLV